MASLERQILVAQVARGVEEQIREFSRNHGDLLKSMGADVKAVQMLGLDIFAEAFEALKTKVQQTRSRIEKE